MSENQSTRYTIYANDGPIRDEECLLETNDFESAEREAEKLLTKFDHVQIYEDDKWLIWHNGQSDCESDN